VEVVASLSQGRTAAAQCGFFTYKSVPVIFEPPCTTLMMRSQSSLYNFSLMNTVEEMLHVFFSLTF